ncbi:MAG TPA: tetratricopeptide repeat protein [Desulfomonilia bacterium]
MKFVRILIGLFVAAAAAGCANANTAASVQEDANQTSPYLTMILARQAEDSGDTDSALKLYQELNNSYAWLNIAMIYIQKSDDEKALEYLNKVLDSGDYIEDALDQKVNIYVRSNKVNEAVAEAEKYYKKYPGNVQIIVLLAKLRLFSSDPEGAIKILEKIPPGNEDIEALYILSRACLEEKNKACAIKSLEKVIELAPDFSQAYIDLGRVYESDGNLDEAISIYTKLCEIDPSSKEARLALADLYILTGRNKDAIAQLKALLEIYPNREVMHKLAILEIDDGMYADAIELLNTQTQLMPEEKYYLAIAYSGQKDFDRAIALLKEIENDPQLKCDVSILKSSILEDMGKSGEAFDELKNTWEKVSKETSCREVGYRLATALEEKGMINEGLAVAESILSADPNDAMMLNFVGYLWADQGRNLEKAKKMISDALTARPDDGFIMDSMGWVLYKSGKPAEAVPYMEKALKKYPDEPLINEHMGDIQYKLGRNKTALEYYQKAKANSKKGVSPALEKKITELIKEIRKTGR